MVWVSDYTTLSDQANAILEPTVEIVKGVGGGLLFCIVPVMGLGLVIGLTSFLIRAPTRGIERRLV